ncbi:MAG: serine/threonine-protein phosphatase [Clostridiales bacterium]|nr:serine/threonine-protein phosphatase [Clostridiales bacterium]
MIADHAFVTDVGAVREVNQDSILCRCDRNNGIFVVADGMGGHSKGEIASAELVHALENWSRTCREKTIETLAGSCRECIVSTSDRLYEQFKSEGLIGGTTAVVLLVMKDDIAVLSVGDSRIYRFDHGSGMLNAVTEDDVWENLPEVKAMPSEEAMKDPRRGKLTTAVGARKGITVKTDVFKASKEEIFLLVSDGVYRFCDTQYASRLISESIGMLRPEFILNDIAVQVMKNGAADNYSAVMVLTRS